MDADAYRQLVAEHGLAEVATALAAKWRLDSGADESWQRLDAAIDEDEVREPPVS